MKQDIIYQDNSVISVETHPDYLHPVVIKKPSKRHPPGAVFDPWQKYSHWRQEPKHHYLLGDVT